MAEWDGIANIVDNGNSVRVVTMRFFTGIGINPYVLWRVSRSSDLQGVGPFYSLKSGYTELRMVNRVISSIIFITRKAV